MKLGSIFLLWGVGVWKQLKQRFEVRSTRLDDWRGVILSRLDVPPDPNPPLTQWYRHFRVLSSEPLEAHVCSVCGNINYEHENDNNNTLETTKYKISWRWCTMVTLQILLISSWYLVVAEIRNGTWGGGGGGGGKHFFPTSKFSPPDIQ